MKQLIVLEGPTGSGKSTVAKALSSYIRDKGYKVCSTREPGGTTYAEKIRELMLFPGAHSEPVCNVTQILLAFAARTQHVTYVINPSIKRGEVVVCERFDASTWAHQEGQKHKDLMEQLTDNVQTEVEPIYVFLDVSYNKRNLRIEEGGFIRDEDVSEDSHNALRNRFSEFVENNADNSLTILTDDLTLDEVLEKVISYVQT